MQRCLIILFLMGSFHFSWGQSKSSEITCEPVRKAGKIVGFTCPQLHEDNLLSKMGLQQQDIIFEFNGKSISSFKDMQKFYEKLHQKGITKVKFKRENFVYSTENNNK